MSRHLTSLGRHWLCIPIRVAIIHGRRSAPHTTSAIVRMSLWEDKEGGFLRSPDDGGQPFKCSPLAPYLVIVAPTHARSIKIQIKIKKWTLLYRATAFTPPVVQRVVYGLGTSPS